LKLHIGILCKSAVFLVDKLRAMNRNLNYNHEKKYLEETSLLTEVAVGMYGEKRLSKYLEKFFTTRIKGDELNIGILCRLEHLQINYGCTRTCLQSWKIRLYCHEINYIYIFSTYQERRKKHVIELFGMAHTYQIMKYLVQFVLVINMHETHWRKT